MGPDVRRSPAGNDPDEIPKTSGPGGRPCRSPAATHEPRASGESPSCTRLWCEKHAWRMAPAAQTWDFLQEDESLTSTAPRLLNPLGTQVSSLLALPTAHAVTKDRGRYFLFCSLTLRAADLPCGTVWWLDCCTDCPSDPRGAISGCAGSQGCIFLHLKPGPGEGHSKLLFF